MVLLGLGTTWGCTQWLHREDYTVFERSEYPDGKMEGASVASSRVRASGKPSQYWLIGFKDRRLEREYLEDLVEVSSSCFIVGTSLALLLYVIFLLPMGIIDYLYSSRYYKMENITVPVGEVLRNSLLPVIVGGLGIVAAFVVCCVHSMGKWKVRKDVILYVIEGGYLLYTGALIWLYLDPGYSGLKGMKPLLLLFCILHFFADSLLSLAFYDPDTPAGPQDPWALHLAIYYVTPYIPLLLMPIPFSATLEIMSIFLLGLVVISPTVMGGWNEFSNTRMLDLFKASAAYDFCPAHADICNPFFRKFVHSLLSLLPSITKL